MDLAKWRHQFETLFAQEGLADIKAFLEPLDEYDEVPLYTRISRITFLDHLDSDDRSVILLGYALELLDKVVDLAASELSDERLQEYFIMLTVVDWDEYNRGSAVTPCFWITTRATTELVNMKLAAPYSSESRKVAEWIRRLRASGQYSVADYPEPPDDHALMRVHVGQRQLPRPMRALHDLMVR